MVDAVTAGVRIDKLSLKSKKGRHLPPFFFELVVASNTNSRDLPKDGSVKKINS